MYKYETRRLILRDFREDDFAAVHAYGSDPTVSVYEPWGPNTTEETKSFIQKAVDSAHRKPRVEYELAACLKGTNELIGSGRVGIDKEASGQVSIGYVVHPKHQGQGYGAEIAEALLDIGFNLLHANLIFATCDVKNAASKRVLEKTGFKLVSRIDNHMEMKGRIRDSFRFEVHRDSI